MPPIVRISHLDKYFGRLYVLKDVSLEVQPQEVVCLIGRSGSGKSTLLRCINFLEEPSAGTVEVDGLVVPAGVRGKANNQLVHNIRLRTGMVFQEFNLFPHLSVIENVIEAPVTVKKMPRDKAIAIGEKFLAKVGLTHKRDEYPNRLSGGQKQRVAIARTLLKNPRILIMDDSTSAVDTETEAEIRAALVSLMEKRTSFIIAHRIQSVMEADLILVLDHGRIVQHGTHAELLKERGIYRRIYDIQTRIEAELERDLAHTEPAGPHDLELVED